MGDERKQRGRRRALSFPLPFNILSVRRGSEQRQKDDTTNVKRRDDSSDLARKGFSAFEAFLLEGCTLIHDNQSFLSFYVSPFRSFMPPNNENMNKYDARTLISYKLAL